MHPDKLLYTAAIVSITSLLLIGIGFLKAQPKNRSAQLFFVICLCAIFYIFDIMDFYSIEEAYQIQLSSLIFLVWALPNAIPGLFMLFCHSLFQEPRRFPGWIFAIWLFHIALNTTLLYVYNILPDTPALFENQYVYQISNRLVDFLLLGFSGGALYWTVKDWRNDLIEGRRILRWIFLVCFSVLIFVIVVSENFVVSTDESYMLSRRITLFTIAVFSFSIALGMTKFDYHLLVNVIEKAGLSDKAKVGDSELDLDINDFKQRFIGNKWYRESGLTIADLADKLSMPEYRLRRLINQRLGFRNFSAMLHHFRVEDAGQTLADPGQKNIPILTIALNVGYNSITPFNTAFRDIKGMTPTEHRKRALRSRLQQEKVAN